MSYAPGEDAEELRQIVRIFLEKRATESEVRRVMDSVDDYDPAPWRTGAIELGLNGLVVPEEHGGAGAGMAELGVVFEELGRSLLPSPFFATVALAESVLLETGDVAAQERYLPGLAAGETTATVAWGGPDVHNSSVRAEGAAASWRLTGRADHVISGAVAGLILVVAQTPDGAGLFAVTDDAGLVRTPLVTMDSTRPLAHLDFEHAVAERVEITSDALQRALDRSILLLAAEQLGGAQRALEMAVEYARTRVQFGRAIGSFQALKHLCADLLVDVESARSVVWHGLWVCDNEPDELATAAMLAGALCSEAYLRVAAANIQIHGGIGFTWEHPAHLYLKRAKSSQLLLGSGVAHRSRLAELLEIPEGA